MDTAFAIDDLHAASDTPAAAPCRASTPTETALARIWAAILERDRVGRDDNFFLLGGDSLRAAALFTEVESAFGVTLPLETVFDEGETVAGMARLVEEMTARRRDEEPGQHEGSKSEIAEIPTDATRREMKVRVPFVERRDLSAAAKLILLSVVACVPGRSRRLSVCRRLAAGLMALRSSRQDRLKDVVPVLAGRFGAKELEMEILADGYEAIVETWRHCVPWTKERPVRLRGAAHIEGALAAGRGAVLWNCPTNAGSGPVLRALATTGSPLAQLRGQGHPYSRSRFGETFLNPLPNRAEDRYIQRLLVVHDKNTVEVMHMLGAHLKANGIVRMSANGAFGDRYDMPFLGGTLSLALGAPMLALLHKVPLIPLFCIPDGADGYELIAEPALTDGSGGASVERARELARQYARILEGYLRRHPHIWRCWFMSNTWRPAGGSNPGNA